MKIYVKNSQNINSNSNISTAEVFEYAETGLVGIVSAFRGYLSYEENQSRTDDLCRLVTGSGYDYAEVTGSFREIGGTIDKERSVLVIDTNPPYKEEINRFRKIMTGFAAKFQQDSVFIIYTETSAPSDIIGELWERKPKYEWGSTESVNESVSRNEYTVLKKFSHITPEIAFSAYSETIDGGAYSIFASQGISEYRQSILRLQARMCSGYASREMITRNRNRILAATE